LAAQSPSRQRHGTVVQLESLHVELQVCAPPQETLHPCVHPVTLHTGPVHSTRQFPPEQSAVMLPAPLISHLPSGQLKEHTAPESQTNLHPCPLQVCEHEAWQSQSFDALHVCWALSVALEEQATARTIDDSKAVTIRARVIQGG
jgi:hypothetical protein